MTGRSSSDSGRIEALGFALDEIAEQLAELAIDRLSVAVSDGDEDAGRQERRITRARRAVEKAAAILREG